MIIGYYFMVERGGCTSSTKKRRWLPNTSKHKAFASKSCRILYHTGSHWLHLSARWHFCTHCMDFHQLSRVHRQGRMDPKFTGLKSPRLPWVGCYAWS